MKPLKPDQLITERIEELERQLAEAATFLDRMADRMERDYPFLVRKPLPAADCRAMAARLRGEPEKIPQNSIRGET